VDGQVRRNAVMAIFTIFKNFDSLIPDAPELIQRFLEKEEVSVSLLRQHHPSFLRQSLLFSPSTPTPPPAPISALLPLPRVVAGGPAAAAVLVTLALGRMPRASATPL
jgi:hypothetical protein